MITDGMVRAGVKRVSARRKSAAHKPQDATTPQQQLVHAAETGRLEAIGAAAQPAEPPTMVTPEEREAELRAAGRWTDAPEAKREAAEPKEPEPKQPEPGMPTEPTPGMTWAEEHMRRRPRASRPRRPTHDPYRCMVEYDVLTGEIIGDGYAHSVEEDDE